MPMQKIFFGPPGCGKSFHVRKVAIGDLKIAETLEDLKRSLYMIETAFHPEYGYGDFVAKLLPQTGSRTVAYKLDNSQGVNLNGTTLTQTTDTPTIEYRIHAGPLIKALARAYANPDKKVLLVIDEINRGNCAQIFGDIFQSLDRDHIGWSEYGINLSDLVMDALKQELEKVNNDQGNSVTMRNRILLKKLQVKTKGKGNKRVVTGCKLRLPPNLSLIGTMNTSDESVYYMDTAFKRRWDFEYMQWEGAGDTPELQKNARIESTVHTWGIFLGKLNAFIIEKFKERNVDDKQVGIWFVNGEARALTLFLADLNKLFVRIEHKYKGIHWASAIEAIGVNGVVVLAVSTSKDEIVDVTKIGELLVKLIEKLREKHGLPVDTPIVKWLSDTFEIFSGKETHAEWKSAFESFQKTNPVLGSFDFSMVKVETMSRPNIGTLGAFFSKIVEAYSSQPDFQVRTPRIEKKAISDKLMFFLWDNVFSRDRKPLYDLLEKGGATEKKPRTFGAFSGEVDAFIKGVMDWDK